MKNFVKKYKLPLSIAGFLLAVCLCLLALLLVNYGKVAYGLTLGKEKIGGKNFRTAQDFIEQKIKKFEANDIVIHAPSTDKKITAKPKDLGIDVSKEMTLENATDYGHRDNFLQNISEQALAVTGAKNINYVYSWDQDIFDSFTEKQKEKLAAPAQEASLKYNFQTNEFDFIKPQKGKTINTQQIKDQIKKSMETLSTKEISVDLIDDQPKLAQKDTNQAKQKAEEILAQTPYPLKANGQTFYVSKEIIADWLNFSSEKTSSDWQLKINLDNDKISKYLDTIKDKINVQPVNASLKFEDGKVSVFDLAKEGIELKQKESAQEIKQNILDLKPESNLILRKVPPLIIGDENIYKLGLTSRLAVGESNFAGSTKSRITNIRVGASKFNGTIIQPGQEFSLNTILGEVGAAQGFVPELVIKGNKLMPEYGGGLCQVATTAFRAAVNAGLKITERSPHAFAVHYYSPVGFDATIYPPHPDLRFINDTPKSILIQTRIEGTKLFFDFYGTNDGREIKIIGPNILQSNPNGSIKTVLYQEIWRDGQKERSDAFWSNYKSPALYSTVQKNPLE